MLKQLDDKLTKEEELELGVKIQEMKAMKARQDAGYDTLTAQEQKVIDEGNKALETLIGNYYNLARRIAHDHHKKTGTKYDLEDLLQDAVSALVESAFAYDPDKNCRLSTYAYYGITKKVSSTINFQRLVRMPENKMGEYVLIAKAQKEYGELSLEEREEYLNELDYVYKKVDLKKSEIDLILTNMQPQVSLNSDVYEGNGELMDFIKDEQAEAEVIELGNLDEKITTVVAKLNEYEKDLIAFEFGAYPASMCYSDFKQKYNIDDRKVKFEIRKVIKKMRKIAERVAL